VLDFAVCLKLSFFTLQGDLLELIAQERARQVGSTMKIWGMKRRIYSDTPHIDKS